jgi:hypothetical protein
MISTQKSELKHLRIEGTRRAQKSNENSSKKHKNHTSYKRENDAIIKGSIHSEV